MNFVLERHKDAGLKKVQNADFSGKKCFLGIIVPNKSVDVKPEKSGNQQHST